MSATWKHPTTGRLLPIVNERAGGAIRTSPALLKFLKDGRTDLLDGTLYLWNAVSKRVLNRVTYYRRDGKMKARWVTLGWTADGASGLRPPQKRVDPATVVRNAAALAKIAKNNYKRPAVTEQDRISRNVADKIRAMKDDGRVEIDGSPSEMIAGLRNFKRSHVSYVTKAGMYRSGGFLTKVDEDGGWIALAAPPIATFSVALDAVEALYVKVPKAKAVDATITPATGPPTRFQVKVGDVVVYNGKDAYKASRFKQTASYKAMMDAFNAS
jgi:hypothetical protein